MYTRGHFLQDSWPCHLYPPSLGLLFLNPDCPAYRLTLPLSGDLRLLYSILPFLRVPPHLSILMGPVHCPIDRWFCSFLPGIKHIFAKKQTKKNKKTKKPNTLCSWSIYCQKFVLWHFVFRVAYLLELVYIIICSFLIINKMVTGRTFLDQSSEPPASSSPLVLSSQAPPC